MKTLDEVIKGLSVCDDVECCYACPHSTDYNGCDVDWGYLTRDALFYLKEYKANQEDPDGDHQQLEKAQKLLWEFYQNDPLTWDELKQMEGKPVWVEYADDEEQTGWALIVKNPERPIFGKPKLFTFVRDEGKFYLTISGYGKRWQAYRKER